jgi:hypothetical protein
VLLVAGVDFPHSPLKNFSGIIFTSGLWKSFHPFQPSGCGADAIANSPNVFTALSFPQPDGPLLNPNPRMSHNTYLLMLWPVLSDRAEISH